MSKRTDRGGKKLNMKFKQTLKSKSIASNTKHCWECFKSNAFCDCTMCEKSFHIKCLSSKYDRRLWKCPECVLFNLEANKSQPSEAEIPNLNELLQIVHNNLELEDCIKHDLMPIVQKQLPRNSDISNALSAFKSDQECIKKNLIKKKYKSTNRFRLDIKAMIFKFFIALDFNDKHYTELENWSKKLLQRCSEDIQCLELCVDCLKNLSTNEVDCSNDISSSELTNQNLVHLKRSHDLEGKNKTLQIELKRIRIEFSKVEQEKTKLITDNKRLLFELEETKKVKMTSAQAEEYDEMKLKISNITAERDEYKKKLDRIETWKKRGDKLWENL